MHTNLFRHFALVLTALLPACSAVPLGPDPHLGHALPLHVEDLATRQPLDPAAWQGHVVLVDLWATWCETCKDAMPHHVALWQRWHAAGLEIVAISIDEDRAAALHFVRETPLPFTVAWDAGQRTANELRPATIPTAYVLDRQGLVIAVARGGTPAAAAQIDAALAAALSATPEVPVKTP
jgi:thiol-disulfide isomerase/thioredoxin